MTVELLFFSVKTWAKTLFSQKTHSPLTPKLSTGGSLRAKYSLNVNQDDSLHVYTSKRRPLVMSINHDSVHYFTIIMQLHVLIRQLMHWQNDKEIR